MKSITTTLFWPAHCARGFEITERRDKMRPIFTETERAMQEVCGGAGVNQYDNYTNGE